MTCTVPPPNFGTVTVGMFATGIESSTRPLQLSSTLLQSSGVGAPAAAALQTTLVCAALQMYVPTRRQAPTPLAQAVPLSGNGSSTAPLQLLSKPSHSVSVAW